MNLRLLIPFCVTAFLFLTNCQQKPKTVADKQGETVSEQSSETKADKTSELATDAEMKKMLLAFYTEYMTIGATDNSKYAHDKQEAVKKKYCTEALIKKIEKELADGELDADPLVNAQDYSLEWLKTLTIKNETNLPDKFIISYTANSDTVTIKTTVVKETTGYKISGIE